MKYTKEFKALSDTTCDKIINTKYLVCHIFMIIITASFCLIWFDLNKILPLIFSGVMYTLWYHHTLYRKARHVKLLMQIFYTVSMHDGIEGKDLRDMLLRAGYKMSYFSFYNLMSQLCVEGMYRAVRGERKSISGMTTLPVITYYI